MSFVNMLPEDYVARQVQRRANMVCLVLFAAVMTTMLTAAFVSQRSLRNTSEVWERVNNSYAEAGKLIQQMHALEAVRQRMFKKANLTAGLLERVPRSYLLAMVTAALPEGGSIREFKLTTKRNQTQVVTATGKKTRYGEAAAERAAAAKSDSRLEVSMTVRGLAATDVEVARFMANMARCPLMETVEIAYSEQKKFMDVVVRDFQVVMRLKENADVLGVEAEGEKALAQVGAADSSGEDR